MTDLECYELVNSSETLPDLANKIMLLSNDKGNVKYTYHNAKKQSEIAGYFMDHQPNMLTRKWGIRQQAMYLLKFNKY